MRLKAALIALPGLLMLAACAAAQQAPATSGPAEQYDSSFRFVVVGDRTGGHRPGVFRNAMARVELLRPDLVITVGDQIEGYTGDEAEIVRQWDEFDRIMAAVSAPVHYIAGNHDVFSDVSLRLWRERRGAPYWSFMHKGVLFIGLSTEDPPHRLSEETMASAQRLEKAMQAAPVATQERLLDAVRGRDAPPKLPGQVHISEEQIAFVEQALADKADARWTFVLMHKPAWQYDSEAFARIEVMLGDRPFTVIAGHEHYYKHEQRSGRDYIVMGTTGGVWLRDGPGRVDHVAMVTMTEDGPAIANLRIDGVFPKEGQPES